MRRQQEGTWARTMGCAALAATCLMCLGGCQPCQPKPPLSPSDGCTRTFLRYEPSGWEREWLAGELSGERRDRECEILATPAEVNRSIRLIRSVQGAMLRGMPIPSDSTSLFSRMVYSIGCGSTSEERVELIEPLIGILRDPLSMCRRPPGVPDEVYFDTDMGEDRFQSKRHFLAAPAVAPREPPRSRRGRKILIDMGASLYTSWKDDPGSVGARWFVDRYRRHGWSFDWIVSYEIEKHDPDEIYQAVPADILPHYLYYNQGVEAEPGAKWNPWRMLREMGVTADDYVVVKLDIDAPDIENALVDQVLQDAGLRRLIDEMFYEHHVNSKPMWPYWQTQGAKATLADSYRNFTRLRASGVRMHSWP